MITVMLSGSISKQPETRTSAKGNSYTVATIRTGEGDDALFLSSTSVGVIIGIGGFLGGWIRTLILPRSAQTGQRNPPPLTNTALDWLRPFRGDGI